MKLFSSQKQPSESFWTLSFLILSGGLQDSYSYFARGQVFANAQTGNWIFLSNALVTGQWANVAKYGFPIAFYLAGILLALSVKHLHKTHNSSTWHWRQSIVAAEIALLFLVPFISLDFLANGLMSLGCGMQYETFRKVHGKPFASTFCMGNMRSMTECFFSWKVQKNPQARSDAFNYAWVLVLFGAGSCLGIALSRLFGNYAIWASCILLAVSGIMMHGRLTSVFVQKGHSPKQERKEVSSL